MKHNRLFSRQNMWGLLIAVVLAAVAGYQAIQFSQDDLLRQHARRGAVMNAMALASLVGSVVENASNKQQAVDGINTIIDEWTVRKLALDSIRVIQDRELLASTVQEDEKLAGPAPRRLTMDEKGLYDVGQELRRNVQINEQEEGVRKAQDIITYLPGGLVEIASPYFVNGKVKGYVQANIYLNIKEQTSEYTNSILLVIIPLLLFAVFSFSPLIPAKDSSEDAVKFVAKPFFSALGLLLIGLISYNVSSIDTYSSIRGAWENQLHKSYREQTDDVSEIYRALNLEDKFNGNRAYALARLYITSNDVEYDSKSNSFDALDSMTIDVIKQVEESETKQISSLLKFISVLSIGIMVFWGSGFAARFWRTLVKYRAAYAYITPAMVAMLLLVFFPFGYGILLSFTKQSLMNMNDGIVSNWVWLENYWDIIKLWDVDKVTGENVWRLFQAGTEGGQGMWNYASFYWTLFMTVCWTVFNVIIGVTFGLILALALNTKGLALRPIYRVLLILPWAIPNYITALIWKGMFHQQFGAINQIIQIFGGEPLAWFDSTFSSFITGLATNGWLSFPFMMVICLGALQSIDASMYEAARVEGATRWQQFKYITLPSLKPTLIPAIILSVVWTFNMFNVIYLVSGGQPAGSTEILITKAYKIAFEEYRYGYAAAYSTVIFGILVLYGTFQNKISKAAEG